MHRAALFVIAAAACGSPSRPAPVANQQVSPPPAPPDAALTENEDCTLQLEAITGKLDHHAAGVRSVAPPVRKDRRITEEIALADGTRVQFSLGGCAHYGWQLTYTGPAAGVPADPEKRLDAVAALLGRTPIADDLGKDMASRIRGRPKQKRAATGPWSIECGDAVCDVDAAADAANVKLTVSYDFPL